MKYLNIILTVLVIALILHLLVRVFPVKSIRAGDIRNVNIAEVGGKRADYGVIRVRIVK